VLPKKIRRVLAKLWPFSLSVVLICFLIALEIAILGFVPRIEDPDTALAISWSLLLAAWIMSLFSFVSGFACDIQRQIEK